MQKSGLAKTNITYSWQRKFYSLYLWQPSVDLCNHDSSQLQQFASWMVRGRIFLRITHPQDRAISIWKMMIIITWSPEKYIQKQIRCSNFFFFFKKHWYSKHVAKKYWIQRYWSRYSPFWNLLWKLSPWEKQQHKVLVFMMLMNQEVLQVPAFMSCWGGQKK